MLGLPRAAHHPDRALPAGRGRAEVRGLAQQHVLAARPRRHPRPRPGGPGLRPAAAGAAAPAGDLGQLAVPGRPRLGPAQRPHADLHQELSALRGTRRLRELGRSSPTTSRCCSRPGSIVEYTQVWWSIRPHLSFGTVEVRICDAQPTAAESDGLAALIVACVAQAARDIDERVPDRRPAEPADRGERLARAALRARRRAARSRAAGALPGGRARSTGCWRGPRRSAPSSGSTSRCPALNGAQRQRRMLETGMSLREVYAAVQARDPRDLFWSAGNSAEVNA